MQIVAISFGSESKSDPVDEVYFYSADQPYIAEEGKNIAKSDPQFKVCIIIIYYYNTVAEKITVVVRAVAKWYNPLPLCMEAAHGKHVMKCN